MKAYLRFSGTVRIFCYYYLMVCLYPGPFEDGSNDKKKKGGGGTYVPLSLGKEALPLNGSSVLPFIIYTGKTHGLKNLALSD